MKLQSISEKEMTRSINGQFYEPMSKAELIDHLTTAYIDLNRLRKKQLSYRLKAFKQYLIKTLKK